MAEKWMQNVKSDGSLGRLAKAAGESTMKFAEDKYHAKGKVGEKARAAVNMQRARKRNKAVTDKGRDRSDKD